MRTALNEVKAVLGPDAVIMSNTKTSEGVEIVAAVDNDVNPTAAMQNTPPPVNNMTPGQDAQANPSPVAPNFRQNPAYQQSSETNNFESDLNEEQVADSLKALLKRQHAQLHAGLKAQDANPNEVNNQAVAPQFKPKQSAYNPRPLEPQQPEPPQTFGSQFVQPESAEQQNAELQDLKNEMAEMRKLMEHQVSGLMWQEMARREPMRAFLVDRLNKLGISNDVADQVASFIPEELSQHEAWEHGLELLSGQLNATNNDILRRGGIVALLGPTGVGKTTTIAKLAAHFAQIHGGDQVAMVTTDTFRIGAHEQLQTYAKILGCPCKVVKDQQELAETLYHLRNKKLVLIDTAGVGQRDIRLAEHLNTLMSNNNVKIRSYLVLQSTAQRRVLQDAIDQFRRIPITGCIFTKVDECTSLGEIISVAIQNALPIAYVSEGQRVPEDIRAAESNYLVSKAAKLMEERNISQPNWFTDDSLQPINK
nr:flagellar biosynthesis protein FlhF [Marinifaba aquimaris]